MTEESGTGDLGSKICFIAPSSADLEWALPEYRQKLVETLCKGELFADRVCTQIQANLYDDSLRIYLISGQGMKLLTALDLRHLATRFDCNLNNVSVEAYAEVFVGPHAGKAILVIHLGPVRWPWLWHEPGPIEIG